MTKSALANCSLTCFQVLHQSIVRVLVIAAGGVKSNPDPDDAESIDIPESDSHFLKPVW